MVAYGTMGKEEPIYAYYYPTQYRSEIARKSGSREAGYRYPGGYIAEHGSGMGSPRSCGGQRRNQAWTGSVCARPIPSLQGVCCRTARQVQSAIRHYLIIYNLVTV